MSAAFLLDPHRNESLPVGTVQMPSGVVGVVGWENGRKIIIGVKTGDWAGVFFWNEGKFRSLATGEVGTSAPRVGPIVADAGSQVCWSLYGRTSFECMDKDSLSVIPQKSGPLVELVGQSSRKCWIQKDLTAWCIESQASIPYSFKGTFSHLQMLGRALYGLDGDDIVLLNEPPVPSKTIFSAPGLSFAAVTPCGLLISRRSGSFFRRDGIDEPLRGVEGMGGFTFVNVSDSSVVFGALLLSGAHSISCGPAHRSFRRHLLEKRER